MPTFADQTAMKTNVQKIPTRQPIQVRRPSREEALEAVRTMIRWAGDDPDREGLLGTPDRVVRSYQEFFSGYDDEDLSFRLQAAGYRILNVPAAVAYHKVSATAKRHSDF